MKNIVTPIDILKPINKQPFVHASTINVLIDGLSKYSNQNKVFFTDDGYVVFQNHVYKYISEVSDLAFTNVDNYNEMFI